MPSLLDLVQQVCPSSSEETRVEGWRQLNPFFNAESRADFAPNTQLAISNGVLGHLLAELVLQNSTSEPCLAARRALSCLTHLSLNALIVQPLVVESKLVPELVLLAGQHPDDELGDLALTCLGSMALHQDQAARKILLQSGVLRLSLKYLFYLDSTKERDIDFGITAGSLLIRLIGSNESFTNLKLVNQIYDLLQLVLDQGENGVVYGYRRDPANILLDISILCQAETNQTNLAKFIPLICRCFWERPGNARAIKFGTLALAELIQNKTCQEMFLTVHEECSKRMAEVIRSEKNREVVHAANRVKHALDNRFAQHVFISYQWNVQEIAQALRNQLIEMGYSTWMDIDNMGPNIQDSMTEAVGNASHILVLFSKKYKDSMHCRLECELGVRLGKKMTLLQVEAGFIPDGWLKNVPQHEMLVPCLNVKSVDSVLKKVMQSE